MIRNWRPHLLRSFGGARSPIAALGVVAFLLAAGQTAFADPLHQVRNCEPSIRWTHRDQFVRTPDCDVVALDLMARNAWLHPSQSIRFDYYFDISRDRSLDAIAHWVGGFCALIGSDDAVMEGRLRKSPYSHRPRKIRVFFACSPSENEVS